MVKNLRSTSGSLLNENHVPKDDDAIVKNIREEGGIIFCKTNTPEFGAEGNTTNKVYGPTVNPFDTKKSAAGSSGGSAAALACDMITILMVQIMQEALEHLLVFVPLRALDLLQVWVPVIDSAVSLNPFSVQGPMGKNVKDTFLLLQAQSDINNNDPFSSLNAISLPDNLNETDLSSVKMAYSSDLGCAPVDKEIKKIFYKKIETIKSNFKTAINDHPNFLDIHIIALR